MQVKFKLAKIIKDQFAIIDDLYNCELGDVNVEANLNTGFDVKNEAVGTSLKIQFYQDQKPFIILQITQFYKIEQEDFKKLKTKNNTIILPKNFITHLVMLTVGTIRGYLHAKLENTKLNMFYLPPIDVTQLVKGDVEMKIKE